MIWILSASLVINFIFLVLLVVAIHSKLCAENTSEYNREQWCKWESLFYEAQDKVLSQFGIFISPIGGAYGKMEIKHNDEPEVKE